MAKRGGGIDTPTTPNKEASGGDDGSRPPEIPLKIVVSGNAVTVIADMHATMQKVVIDALQQSNQVGQPPENWELKDDQGNVLDLSKKVKEFRLTPNATLFLSLKAGAAGGR